MIGRAYGVAGGILLFCADDGTTSLGLVEGAFAADYSLALRGTTSGFAADLGDGIPVVHDVCNGKVCTV